MVKGEGMKERRFRGLTFWAGLVVALALAVGVTANAFGANKRHVYADICGTFALSQSFTFTQNITCDPGQDGIIVGSDGLTINLNGYTLAVDGGDCGTEGVDNFAGYSRLTVENGTITGFDDGILVGDSHGSGQSASNVFKNLTITTAGCDAGGNGIEAYNITHTLINRVTVNLTAGGENGIYIDNNEGYNPTANTVKVAVVNGAGKYSNTDGVYLENENGDLVSQSTTNKMTDAGFVDYADSCGDTGGNTFAYNVANGEYGDGDGFDVTDTFKTTLTSNYATSGDDGFNLVQDGCGYIVATANAASRNEDDGFHGWENYVYDTQQGSTFVGNHSNGNNEEGFDLARAYWSYVNTNNATGNTETGFHFYQPQSATITYNTASSNGDFFGFFFPDDAGFRFTDTGISHRPHSVSNNLAINNNGFGFWSEDPPNLPGGHNHVSGGTFGCVNVNCS